MATYAEIYRLLADESALRQRVRVGVLVAAKAVRDEADTTPNHANRLLWAKRALSSPFVVADEIFPYLLAANVASTVTQIENASDAAILSAVNDAIDLFATG